MCEKSARSGERALISVLSGLGCWAGGVFLAGIEGAAVIGEGAARVLPGFAFVVPVEPELGELRAEHLVRLFGEGDPHPAAHDLGKLEGCRSVLAEEVKDLISRKRTVGIPIGVVHERKNAGARGNRGRWCRRRERRSRSWCLGLCLGGSFSGNDLRTDQEPFIRFSCFSGFHGLFFCW